MKTRRLACVAAFAAAAALPLGPASAALPDDAASCAAGALVDATFRDASLAALDRLVVRAPGRPADGAVRVHHSPGYVDAQGRAWQQVSAYQVNLGLIGALRVAPSLQGSVAGWLRWQSRHMDIAGLGAARGVVLDHWLRAGDLAESTCPPGIAAALCNHVDAFDSTAASLLLLADAYAVRTGDAALLREPAMRQALEAAAGALIRLTQPDGLTWAKPTHPVAYLMDAVEVIAGWRAWARIQREVLAEPASASISLDFVRRGDAALRSRLWDAKSGLWRVHAGGVPARLDRWYPDTVAQAWPLLWSAGLDAEAATRARDAWKRAAGAWRGSADWAARNVDPAGFWWPAAAVAAHCTGDVASARTWVRRARARWLSPAEPFAWPFQIGDLLWLSWLAEPQPGAAAAAAAPRPPAAAPLPSSPLPSSSPLQP